MQANDGRIAVMSPEGDVFDLMAGKYSKSGASNFGVYTRGHEGDDIVVDRITRPSDRVRRPAITLGLTVQPDILRGLSMRPDFRGRGLLGRFLYSVPKSLVGSRVIDPPPLPPATRKAYHHVVTTLLHLPFAPGERGEHQPHVLKVSPEAYEVLSAFQAELEPMLADGGELGAYGDWAGKLAGAVSRIAALLHMAVCTQQEVYRLQAVSAETMSDAISIGRYLIPHAKAAFGDMNADPVVEGAKRILKWIRKGRKAGFSTQELWQGVKGYFRTSAALHAPLALLEQHRYIRAEAPPAREGAGRKAAPNYAVNPAMWS